MSDNFENFGVQYQFTESIGSSYSSPFHSKEEIIKEYRKQGFHHIELRNAVDSEGNILAYTFNIYCYKPKDENESPSKTSAFVGINDFMKKE